jgi:hypothetical protein
MCAAGTNRSGSRDMCGNRFGLEFHHFGLAVRNPNDAFRYLQCLGYTISRTVNDPLQRVQLALCTHPEMPRVEVVWPGEGASPIDALIREHSGLVYHLCYTAEAPEAAVAAMEQAGLNVAPASAAKEAVLFGGREVAFFLVENVGLIEIIRGNPAERSDETR